MGAAHLSHHCPCHRTFPYCSGPRRHLQGPRPLGTIAAACPRRLERAGFTAPGLQCQCMGDRDGLGVTVVHAAARQPTIALERDYPLGTLHRSVNGPLTEGPLRPDSGSHRRVRAARRRLRARAVWRPRFSAAGARGFTAARTESVAHINSSS